MAENLEEANFRMAGGIFPGDDSWAAASASIVGLALQPATFFCIGIRTTKSLSEDHSKMQQDLRQAMGNVSNDFRVYPDFLAKLSAIAYTEVQ